MSQSARIGIVLICAATFGCQSAERMERDRRQLEWSANEHRGAADDMGSRGDKDPERRESLEQTALELDDQQEKLEAEIKEQEQWEEEHPIQFAIGDFFSSIFRQMFWQMILPGDCDDDDDDLPGFENDFDDR